MFGGRGVAQSLLARAVSAHEMINDFLNSVMMQLAIMFASTLTNVEPTFVVAQIKTITPSLMMQNARLLRTKNFIPKYGTNLFFP